MFSIYEFSEEENRLVRDAPKQFGNYFKLAKDTVDYSWGFIETIEPQAYVFNAFLTQVNKSLSLALLSIVRMHTAQSFQVIRNAIESASLACFALCNPNENNFIRRDVSDPNKLYEKSKVKYKAYSWLDEKYPKYSKHLSMIKSDFINKFYAHSNLIDAKTNVLYGDNKVYNTVFDDMTPLTIRMQLVSLSNLTLLIIELMGLVMNEYPLARVKAGHTERINHFRAINMNQFKTIRRDPLYPTT